MIYLLHATMLHVVLRRLKSIIHLINTAKTEEHYYLLRRLKRVGV